MTRIEAYPWVAPTEEQKAMFDSLSPEQQLDMLRQAIIDGMESGDASELDMEDIIRNYSACPSRKLVAFEISHIFHNG